MQATLAEQYCARGGRRWSVDHPAEAVVKRQEFVEQLLAALNEDNWAAIAKMVRATLFLEAEVYALVDRAFQESVLMRRPISPERYDRMRHFVWEHPGTEMMLTMFA